MINYCHISPVSTLNKVAGYNTHLLLAHLVEENEAYRNFYIDLKKKNPGVFYHLDNSAFEKFKRGEEFYNPDKLMDMARLVSANSIVMSDYPKEPSSKTIEAAKTLIPKFKSAGFQTFFCPQSELGDIEGLISSFDWAIKNRDIDFIGVSILACPIALGINEQKYEDGRRDESYRMQRYLARWRIFEILRQRGMLDDVSTSYRFHCLGMTDGPREIDLLRQYHKHIFSWDSSMSVWRAINGLGFDDSPTGLRHGKYEEEVDFDIPLIDDVDIFNKLDENLDFVDRLCL